MVATRRVKVPCFLGGLVSVAMEKVEKGVHDWKTNN
jgi:hypothetical protein